MKTFIKYSGNKSKYVKYLIPHIPKEYSTYIEPFVGSGAMLLNLHPKNWIISDINTDLINIWKCVLKSHITIMVYFKKFKSRFLKLPSKEAKLIYCRKKTKQLSHLPYNENRASLYLLLKYCVYMGNLIRNNKFYFRGFDLNLLDETKPIHFFSDKYFLNLKIISEYMNESIGHIYNKDYKIILKNAKRNDFVFLDPPYIEDQKYDFNYNPGENLNNTFIDELRKELKKLDQRKVKWMMTQADTPYVRQVFRDYNISTYDVYRIQSRSYKTELIIKNYSAV